MTLQWEPSSLDLSEPIRTAILANTDVVALLASFKSSYPVFTRRPAPVDAPYPMILVSPDISISSLTDMIHDFRPVQVRDVIAYGENTTAKKYRNVETLGHLIRGIFHSNRQSIDVTGVNQGWNVVNVTAAGPVPAPTDDDQTIARMVTITFQLARLQQY
jgi:hypothetical protein